MDDKGGKKMREPRWQEIRLTAGYQVVNLLSCFEEADPYQDRSDCRIVLARWIKGE